MYEAVRVHQFAAADSYHSDKSHKSDSHGDDSASSSNSDDHDHGYSFDDSHSDDHLGLGYHGLHDGSSSSSHDHDDGYSFDDSHDDDHHGHGLHGLHGLHGGLLGSSLLLTGLTSVSSVTTTTGCTSNGGVCLGAVSCYTPHDDSDGSHSDGVLKGRAIGTCDNSLVCKTAFSDTTLYTVTKHSINQWDEGICSSRQDPEYSRSHTLWNNMYTCLWVLDYTGYFRAIGFGLFN